MWGRFRGGREFRAGPPPPSTRYPGRFPPKRVRVDRVDVLVAPDNAEAAMVALIDSAGTSIRVQQVSIGSPDHPFVRALFRAARRVVRVRVLLSGAWYVEEDNRALADALNARISPTPQVTIEMPCAASERGVRIQILFDTGSVGGITHRSTARLKRIDACGVAVALVRGDGTLSDFHHASYAVVDDRIPPPRAW